MIDISNEQLDKIKESFKNKKVAVIGDVMLDCYFWGEVKRISPEAPVPVVEVDNEFARFGGAANCAYNILKLGATPYLIGVIGDDEDGVKFNQLMQETGISYQGLIKDSTRPTTAKTRVIAHDHHIVRIDKESKDPIDSDIENKIISYVEENIQDLDAVILQDYNKGVLTKKIITSVIELANKYDKIVTVDPKFNNFFDYKNVTVFKPNRKESEDALGLRIKSEEDLLKAGNKLLEKLNTKYALLTLGEEGLALFEKNHAVRKIPTKARKVADVSGAGDTVISTLTVALAAGAEVEIAAYLANYAGGLVCEEVGIVPIEVDFLFDMVRKK